MKPVYILSLVFLTMTACSSPKKAPVKDNRPKISSEDRFLGGTSFSNPVVILVRTEAAGLQEEYKWLSNSYPGYKLISRSHTTRASKQFDIVRIKTVRGQPKEIYFDATSFWGRK